MFGEIEEISIVMVKSQAEQADGGEKAQGNL